MNLVPSESMRRWDTMFARWTAFDNRLRSDVPDFMAMLAEDLKIDLMAEVSRRPAAPLGPVELLLTDHRFECNTSLLLAEVLVLDLLTPDPFPTFILLPRLHRLGNLYRKARNAWPSRP